MQIAPGVYSMDQSKGGHVHAFLLDEGTALTLIDTLFDTDARRIIDRIGSIGRSVEDLKHIVLTHAHRSHLGGLATLKELSGATVYSHAWEADIVAGERTAQPVTPVPMRPLSTYWSVYYLQLGAALGRGKHPPCPVDTTLEDGDTVGPVRVLHTPGHTPGHLAFWWPESRALFAGDAIATYPVFGPGWPAFTLNPTQHRASLRRMAELDPAVLAVGHGDPLTAGAAERVRSLVEYR
ncbi:MAG: MBL fold metallo-hydrolase [Actinomycetota bacterium]|jgi:glyoxylase-like metal-dependent hydrolase (beta-lactamase superfamily II)|nr:MBL fold metallo-hydrolase [Actinomycetota bacterium]